MNCCVKNELFPFLGQIAQIYSSTLQKPGAATANVVNFKNQQKQLMTPENHAACPTQLTNYGAVLFNNVVYIVGGLFYNEKPSDQIFYIKNDAFYLSKVRLPFPLYDFAISSSEEYICIYGGRTGTDFSNKLVIIDKQLGITSFPQLEDKEVFDLHFKNSIGNWPESLVQASMCSDGTSFYLFGGHFRKPNRQLLKLEIIKYPNRIQPLWEAITINVGPEPEFGTILVYYKQCLYLFNQKDGEVYKYDKRWSYVGECEKSEGGWYFDGRIIHLCDTQYDVGCW